jgi:hypothetical protein
MGISIGIASFTDGDTMYFDYQNTSDQVVSGLMPETDSPKLIQEQSPKPLTQQPCLAAMKIDYGSGINWDAWSSNSRAQIIINLTKDGADDFSNTYIYGLDQEGKAHLVKVASGFGYSSIEILCGQDNQFKEVSMQDAEGSLCLDCINTLLGLKKS